MFVRELVYVLVQVREVVYVLVQVRELVYVLVRKMVLWRINYSIFMNYLGRFVFLVQYVCPLYVCTFFR